MFTLQRFYSFVQSYVYKEDLQWVPLYFLQLPPTVLIFFSHVLCWQCLLISSADTEQLIKGWLSLVHYCCLNLKRCSLSLPSFFTGFGSQPLGFICTPVPLTHSCLPGSITCIQLQTTNRLQYSPGGRFCAVGSSSARKMKGQYIK